MGKTFTYSTELPDLDDAPSLIEKAEAFKSLQALGFDDKSAIKAVGLDHIKWNGKPAPEPVRSYTGTAGEDGGHRPASRGHPTTSPASRRSWPRRPRPVRL